MPKGVDQSNNQLANAILEATGGSEGLASLIDGDEQKSGLLRQNLAARLSLRHPEQVQMDGLDRVESLGFETEAHAANRLDALRREREEKLNEYRQLGRLARLLMRFQDVITHPDDRDPYPAWEMIRNEKKAKRARNRKLP